MNIYPSIITVHCNHVKNKVAQSNFIISRAKNFLPQSSPLYYALVHPHLLYCLPIYAYTTAKNINMLELLQRKAIGNITNSNYTAHTAPMFNSLKNYATKIFDQLYTKFTCILFIINIPLPLFTTHEQQMVRG